jgi:REP element-mobilizing transposase RayT
MRRNEYGQTVADCWQWLSEQYVYVGVDAWVLMPNHFHGIVVITDAACRGGSRTAPTTTVIRKPLGRIIGAFKTVSTKRINQMRCAPGVPIWQRNYYEHVVRNEDEMNRIREYILNNPAHWPEDENHPARAEKAMRDNLKELGYGG